MYRDYWPGALILSSPSALRFALSRAFFGAKAQGRQAAIRSSRSIRAAGVRHRTPRTHCTNRFESREAGWTDRSKLRRPSGANRRTHLTSLQNPFSQRGPWGVHSHGQQFCQFNLIRASRVPCPFCPRHRPASPQSSPSCAFGSAVLGVGERCARARLRSDPWRNLTPWRALRLWPRTARRFLLTLHLLPFFAAVAVAGGGWSLAVAGRRVRCGWSAARWFPSR